MAVHVSITDHDASPAIRRLMETSPRRLIEDEVERLIGLLDLIDPDPDLEPSLGSPERQPRGSVSYYSQPGFRRDEMSSQLDWAAGLSTDDEIDSADEPEEPGALMMFGYAIPEIVRVRRGRR